MQKTSEINFNEINNVETKLYKRRWIILILFNICTIVSNIPVFQYSIIANLVRKYYNVSALAVDWTSIIFMALYVPMALPTAYILNRWGVRVATVLAAVGTAIGAIINAFATTRDSFWVILIGQSVLAIAQVPLFTLPPCLAAVWFGPKEISTACSLALFGLQFGLGIGFITPTLIVKNHDNVDDIGEDIQFMHRMFVGCTVLTAIAIVVYFPARPPLPPSITQYKERNQQDDINFFTSLKQLMKNKGFLLHMTAYSINISVFSAIATHLNQFVVSYFPDSDGDAGIMGLILVMFGAIGCVAFGVFLDRSRKYKETTVGVFILSFAGVILFMYSLKWESKPMLYFTSGFIGLFTNAYTPASYEFAIEIAFPTPEGTIAGILLAMSQIAGVFFTLLLAKFYEMWSSFWALSTQAAFLLLGIVLTILIPNDLRRQEAFKNAAKKENELMLHSVDFDDKIDDKISNNK